MLEAKWNGWTGQPAGVGVPVSCLECKRWASRWDTVPRQAGCSIWPEIQHEMEDAARERPLDAAGFRAAEAAAGIMLPVATLEGPAFHISGSNPAQDGQVCPRFRLKVESLMDTMTPEQAERHERLKAEAGTLYAQVCKVERDCAKLTRFDGVPDAELCREVHQQAEAVMGGFRPVKTQVSSLDALLRDGSQWQLPTPAENLDAAQAGLEEAQEQLSQLFARYNQVCDFAAAAPERLRQKEAEQEQLHQQLLQERYDAEFATKLKHLRGLRQQLKGLGFFARGQRRELEVQVAEQEQDIAAFNQTYQGMGIVLRDLGEIGIAEN